MINFYLENVFLITVIVVGLAVIIPILGLLILRLRGSSIENRPDIKDSLVQVSAGLFMAGFIAPLIITLLIKINPNFIKEAAPYAGYFIIILVILLIFINLKRFKVIKNKKTFQLKTNTKKAISEKEIISLEEKIQEYKFQMIILTICISYMAILFNLRSF